MNENLDLTKILEGCPIGTEFYSLIYGKVWLVCIDLNSDYPIRFSLHNNNTANASVTKKGTHVIGYNGECTLFPSKDQRDWSKFIRFWDKLKKKKFDVNTLQPFNKVLVSMVVCFLAGHVMLVKIVKGVGIFFKIHIALGLFINVFLTYI